MTEGSSSGQLGLGDFHRFYKSQGQTERGRRVEQLLRQLLPSDLTSSSHLILPTNLQSSQAGITVLFCIDVFLIVFPALIFLALLSTFVHTLNF